jgi:hypothetical protein
MSSGYRQCFSPAQQMGNGLSAAALPDTIGLLKDMVQKLLMSTYLLSYNQIGLALWHSCIEREISFPNLGMLSSIGDLSLILYANGGKDHCSDHEFGGELLAISFIKVVKTSPTVGSVVFITKFYKKTSQFGIVPGARFLNSMDSSKTCSLIVDSRVTMIESEYLPWFFVIGSRSDYQIFHWIFDWMVFDCNPKASENL